MRTAIDSVKDAAREVNLRIAGVHVDTILFPTRFGISHRFAMSE